MEQLLELKARLVWLVDGRLEQKPPLDHRRHARLVHPRINVKRTVVRLPVPKGSEGYPYMACQTRVTRLNKTGCQLPHACTNDDLA